MAYKKVQKFDIGYPIPMFDTRAVNKPDVPIYLMQMMGAMAQKKESIKQVPKLPSMKQMSRMSSIKLAPVSSPAKSRPSSVKQRLSPAKPKLPSLPPKLKQVSLKLTPKIFSSNAPRRRVRFRQKKAENAAIARFRNRKYGKM